MVTKMLKHLRNYFLTGLFLLIPIAVTILILVWGFNQTDAILGDLIYRIFKVRIIGLGLVTLLLLITVMGMLAQNYLGRKLIEFGEKILHRIPIFSNIYSATKQITDTLTKADKNSFRRVVLVEYPRTGIYSVGFLTGDAPLNISQKTGKKVLSILIPTIPNPVGGFLIYVPQEGVIFLDMSIEDGFKLIISAGVIQPKENHD
jgi:Uncharacterized conserved protein